MNSAAAKIKRRSILKNTVEELKAAGKTVVFTNGCFDILHLGHVRYLQDAKALGDCLIVAVNTDDSVKRLKGDSRPLVPEFERAELVAALQCVDYVTLFDEDTPTEIIEYLQPDIHVKGGDYQADDLPESQAVKSYGGKIVIIPLTEGKSTTNLIQRIVEVYGS
ncbi:MAG TPA: D-glycero-beta-D-manno-heptose 1-phosphate adenylyltransferase [Armatimonadota bacterium]|nr:D-glycero-beta-D-manno-heptose 1-phosphate adenylyltransferase [Armatimonadota bacterium]HOM70770.1 D-glycero-beta-D-manno-heptose 1-phosphate adenylyltransferase [Armatimonadota bacterium]HPP74713.1 D-glycero-beta-D-manno-heptose 1-phosphate adenylyltransferase [Armatimonadota bacterium]